MCSNFANQGFISVAVGYRTNEKFPKCIEDVSDALKWISDHIEEDEFGGDKNKVFLVGHSAGGQLASMVTLDKSHLESRGINQDFIKGVIGISGVYNLFDPLPSTLVSWFTKTMYINYTFGENEQELKNASPYYQLNKIENLKTPPFLILNAGYDFGLETQGKSFYNSLEKNGVESQYFTLDEESHGSISRSLKAVEISKLWIQPML